MPVTKPSPLRPLRRQAYLEGTPLVGPEGDPEGWIVLPTYKYLGTLFNTRKAEVSCTVSLHLPHIPPTHKFRALQLAIANPVGGCGDVQQC